MKKTYILSVSLIIIFLLLFVIFINFGINETTITDEDILFQGGKSILNYDSLKIDNSLNQESNTCLINNYMYSMDGNKNIFFNLFPTEGLFYAYFMSLLGENFFFYLPFVFASLCLIFLFLITDQIIKSKSYSVLIILIVLFSGIFLKISLGYWDILPSILFLLISLFILLRYDNQKLYVLGGIFFILAISVRISEIIYLLPFILLIIIKKSKISKKLRIFWYLFPLIIFLFSLLLINFKFYSDPLFLSKSYSTFYPCYSSANYDPSSFLQKFVEVGRYFYKSENFLQNIFNHIIYFFKANMLFTPFFMFFGVGIVSLLKRKKYNYLIFLLFSFIMALFLYGSGNKYYGYLELNLQSAFFRYSLFSSLLIAPIILTFFKDKISLLKNPLKIFIIFFMMMIIFNSLMLTYNFQKNGISNYNQIREDNIFYKEFISSNIENKSYVITTLYTDKFISPVSYNLISFEKYLTNNQIPEEEIYNSLFSLVDNLLEKNENIFLVFDNYNDSPNLINKFHSKMYKLSIEKEDNIIKIYRITK